MRDGTYPVEEVIRLGRETYEREVRAQLQASCDGEFVVVGVTTGAMVSTTASAAALVLHFLRSRSVKSPVM